MKKYIIYVLAVLLISFLIYKINSLSIYKSNIPYSSIFINKDSLITIALAWQKQYTVVYLNDLKNDKSTNLSKGKIIEKCTPIYYNDSVILFSYDLNPKDKWAILDYRKHETKWISEDESYLLMKRSFLISNQPLMTDHSYDPEKLPDDVFLADNFQGAQYMVDNQGKTVHYKGNPVLVVQTGEIKEQSVNRFSRFHRHRLMSILVKKYYIGLYDENKKRFEWVIKCDEPSSSHYRTIYFDGVYRNNETEVLILINKEIDKLDLENGTMQIIDEIHAKN
jgi:hypothetical protein